MTINLLLINNYYRIQPATVNELQTVAGRIVFRKPQYTQINVTTLS